MELTCLSGPADRRLPVGTGAAVGEGVTLATTLLPACSAGGERIPLGGSVPE